MRKWNIVQAWKAAIMAITQHLHGSRTDDLQRHEREKTQNTCKRTASTIEIRVFYSVTIAQLGAMGGGGRRRIR